jgi:two-component system CheB/CheR fusion protein
VVDAAGQLVTVNDRARRLFNLNEQDIGRPFHDLELSDRPVELRSKSQQAYIERRPSKVFDAEWRDPAGDSVGLEVQIVPLVDEQKALLGASVTFTDVTRSRRFQQELEHANRDLEDAYAELQSTNEETRNHQRGAADHQRRALAADHRAEPGQRVPRIDLGEPGRGRGGARRRAARAGVEPPRRGPLGVRPEEVQGRHFLNLDIGLPVEQVRPALRTTLAGEETSASTMIEATNRRGRHIRIRVTCSPLLGSDQSIQGVIVLLAESVQRDGHRSR